MPAPSATTAAEPTFSFQLLSSWSVPETFARLTDWPRHAAPGTSVTVTHRSSAGVGTTFVARTALGRVGFDDHMEVTQWCPEAYGTTPAQCRITKTGPVVFGWATIDVWPVASGAVGDSRSVVRWEEHVYCGTGWLARASALVAAQSGPMIFKPLVKKLLAG